MNNESCPHGRPLGRCQECKAAQDRRRGLLLPAPEVERSRATGAALIEHMARAEAKRQRRGKRRLRHVRHQPR